MAGLRALLTFLTFLTMTCHLSAGQEVEDLNYNDVLIQELKEAKENASKAERAVTVLQARVADYEARLERLEAEVTSSRAQIISSQSELDRCNDRLEISENTTSTLNEVLNLFQSGNSAELGLDDTNSGDLNIELDDEINNIINSVGEFHENLTNSESSLEQCKFDNTKLQDDLANNVEKIKQLEENIIENYNLMTRFKNNAETCTFEFNNFKTESEIKSLNLTSTLTTLSRSIQQCEDRKEVAIERANDEFNAECESKIRNNQEIIAKLQEYVKRSSSETDRSKIVSEACKVKLSEAEQKNKILNITLLQNRARSYNDIRKCENEKKKLRDSCESEKIQFKSLQSDLDNCKQMKIDENEQLSMKISQCESQVRTCNRDLSYQDNCKVELENVTALYKNYKHNLYAERYNNYLKLKKIQEIIQALHDIGFNLQGYHHYLTAIEILKQCHKAEVAIHGGEHGDSINVLINMGWVYYTAREYEKALEIDQKAYNISFTTLGENNKYTIQSLYYLAHTYNDYKLPGNDMEALRLFKILISKGRSLLSTFIKPRTYEEVTNIIRSLEAQRDATKQHSKGHSHGNWAFG